MSMRKILVQYIGPVLCLPELEREVEEIAIRDKDFQIIQRFVPERTCQQSVRLVDGVSVWTCSNCGAVTRNNEVEPYPFCPWCGARCGWFDDKAVE